VAVPIILAISWSIYLTTIPKFKTLHVLAVVLSILFIHAVIVGFAHWEGNKWHLKFGIAFIFGIAIAACWFFAFILSCLIDYYSFHSYTALLFTANFIPICYLVYKKTTW
jgi:hypothetical protein